MTTNGQVRDYPAFAAGHDRAYSTPITYQVFYDDDAWVQSPGRVASRMWITTERPGEAPTTMEIVFIATFLDGRIHRLWELTWPDRSALKPSKIMGVRARPRRA